MSSASPSPRLPVRGTRSGYVLCAPWPAGKNNRVAPALEILLETEIRRVRPILTVPIDEQRGFFDSILSPFTNFLRTWDYRPVTSWFAGLGEVDGR